MDTDYIVIIVLAVLSVFVTIWCIVDYFMRKREREERDQRLGPPGAYVRK